MTTHTDDLTDRPPDRPDVQCTCGLGNQALPAAPVMMAHLPGCARHPVQQKPTVPFQCVQHRQWPCSTCNSESVLFERLKRSTIETEKWAQLATERGTDLRMMDNARQRHLAEARAAKAEQGRTRVLLTHAALLLRAFIKGNPAAESMCDAAFEQSKELREAVMGKDQ
jgi:hypothetical protein